MDKVKLCYKFTVKVNIYTKINIKTPRILKKISLTKNYPADRELPLQTEG